MEEEKELLKQLITNSNRQLIYVKITCIAASIVMAVILICSVILVPKAVSFFRQADDILQNTLETIDLANVAIESITHMSDSIAEMGKNMDDFVTKNSETATEVMSKIDAIDFDGLNGAIENLGDVVEPVAKFFNVFK